MTQNDGGTPYEPTPDPETPPTQPLPDASRGAEEPAGAPQEPAPAGPGPGAPSEQSGTNVPSGQPVAPYGQPNAPYGQAGAAAPYGQPGAPVTSQQGYAQSPPKNDLAVWSLITGILSFVFCPLLLGIAAIITGTMSRKAADQGLANNRGMGTAGLILGWVNVALVVVGIVLFFVLLAAGLLSGGFGDWGDWGNMNDMGRHDMGRHSDY